MAVTFDRITECASNEFKVYRQGAPTAISCRKPLRTNVILVNPATISSRLPRHIWLLAALYCVASLVHFVHNAEFIAFYPNMPAWITRESVYLVWLAITGVGVAGAAISLVGFPRPAALLIGTYGAFGLDGLGHYALALCSQHTVAMNFTIWFEVASGVVLTMACVRLVQQRILHRSTTS